MASSRLSYGALGAADPIRDAFRALAGAGTNNAMASAQGGLIGAQTAEAAQKARAIALTNNSRENPFSLLDDPQVAEYARANPSYANALRVGLGLFGATGEGDIAGMLSKIQGSDLTGQAVTAGNKGDLPTQNRLVSAASGKTYEPFKAVGETGYSIDAATGAINEVSPALAALFGNESAAKVAKNLRENATGAITYDPVSQMLIDKNNATARPVTLPGADAGQLFGKRAQDAKAERIAVDAATSDLDRLANATNEVLSHPGLSRITGLVGMVPNRPGGDAADAKALMETLRSQIGFSVLQAMRAASKTGGALGAVSDKENEMLQNNLAALSTSQSPEQMRASLQNILQYVDNSKRRITDAYASMYGAAGPGASTTGQASLPPPQSVTQRQPVRRAAYQGRVIVQYDDGSMEYE